MTSRRDWKPDYGLYLAGKGMDEQTFYWPGFPIDAIAVRTPGEYSVNANMTADDGNEYAATFDFEQDVFDGFIDSLPGHMADAFRETFGVIDEGPALVRLPEPLQVVMSATLGEVAHGDAEDFIPLLAQEITYLG